MVFGGNVAEHAMILNFKIDALKVRTCGISSAAELLDGSGINPENKPPKLTTAPMMLARRLAPGTRQAVDLGAELLKTLPIDACVFSSRYGETLHSAHMLEAIAAGEAVSPTDFAVSVHNAAAANATIVTKQMVPCSSVSAGENSFPAALIEAVTMLHSGCQKVAVVDFDNKMPELFTPFLTGTCTATVTDSSCGTDAGSGGIAPDADVTVSVPASTDLSYAVALVLSPAVSTSPVAPAAAVAPENNAAAADYGTWSCTFIPQDTAGAVFAPDERIARLPDIPALRCAAYLAAGCSDFVLNTRGGQWHLSREA